MNEIIDSLQEGTKIRIGEESSKHGPFHSGDIITLSMCEFEKYVELEQEIFFGLKAANKDETVWKRRICKEAIQVAAMSIRIIQELT